MAENGKDGASIAVPAASMNCVQKKNVGALNLGLGSLHTPFLECSVLQNSTAAYFGFGSLNMALQNIVMK